MDWRNPDYCAIFEERTANLKQIRDAARLNPTVIDDIKAHYRDDPGGIADFITDWGVTWDPRNPERGLPALIPFVLFPKQREWIDWFVGHWRSQTPGLCEKSRDMGISWLAVATADALCIFYEGLAIGFGSRKEEYVDKIGTMKPLLPKARMFMEHLPVEFRGGWEPWRDAPFMRINFPATGSIIMGEAGDQIGRGDRASIYVVDEAAHLERPDLVEMSLSQTTNCRIDMSSVNGMNNPFAQKRHAGKVDVFVFDWRDDPRKDDEWYRLLSAGEDEGGRGLDPVTIAQEVDRDYSASVSGIVIPAAWVKAAIGAREKLGLPKHGRRTVALDIADEGTDKNALVGSTGIEVDHLEEFSGKGSDIFATVERAFEACDELGASSFRYDADGVGASARGDARVINDRRRANKAPQIAAVGYRGSEGVLDPEGIVEGTIGLEGDKGRENQDFFGNRKAQNWWGLRRLFRNTHRWVVEGKACSPDEIISIDPKLPLLHKLVSEISQPTRSFNGQGKMIVNKTPQGMKSPNLADGLVIDRARMEDGPIEVTPEMVQKVMRMPPRRRRY